MEESLESIAKSLCVMAVTGFVCGLAYLVRWWHER